MKKELLLLILIIFHLDMTLSSNFTYDSDNDIVYFKGRKFVDIDNTKLQLNSQKENLTISDGSPFWYYLLSILCKK